MRQMDLRPLQAEIAEIDIEGFNDIHDWNINSTDYDAKARIRKNLVEKFKHLTDETDYTSGISGWKSYVEMPCLGVVAFIPIDSDELDYHW